jgi:ketosteroid isomerase-like protein
MAVSEQDLELIRTAYELWNAGDVEGLVERCMSEDFEWHDAPEFPDSGVFRGREAVKEHLVDEVMGIIGLGGTEITSIDVVGNEIVVTLRAKVRGQQSDVELGWLEVFHVTSVEGGMAKRTRVFLEREDAMRAAGSA